MENREEFISDNLGLVYCCAKRFRGRGIEFEDLVQAGALGLVKATDAFDQNRGVKFSTYAVPVILGEMKRLFRDGGTVKVGRTLKELSLRVTKESELIREKEGREPTLSELAERLQISLTETAEALGASVPPLSLTSEEDEDEGGQLDVSVDSPEEGISDRLALRQELSELSPKDREIIILRFYQHRTQTQTAEVLGMTQVQISRREKYILGQLRLKLTG